MSEKVGRHKGAVETLMHEQKELSRLLQIVQGQLERHMNALEDAGVDTEEFVENLQEKRERNGTGQSDANEQRSENRNQQGKEGRREREESSQSTRQSGDDGEGSSSEDVDDFLEGEDDSENDDFAPY
jgi:hypothetical protein